MIPKKPKLILKIEAAKRLGLDDSSGKLVKPTIPNLHINTVVPKRFSFEPFWKLFPRLPDKQKSHGTILENSGYKMDNSYTVHSSDPSVGNRAVLVFVHPEKKRKAIVVPSGETIIVKPTWKVSIKDFFY